MPNQPEHWLIQDARKIRDLSHFRISDSINCRFAGAVKTLAAIHSAEDLKAAIDELVTAHDVAIDIAHKRQMGPDDGIELLEQITEGIPDDSTSEAGNNQ